MSSSWQPRDVPLEAPLVVKHSVQIVRDLLQESFEVHVFVHAGPKEVRVQVRILERAVLIRFESDHRAPSKRWVISAGWKI